MTVPFEVKENNLFTWTRKESWGDFQIHFQLGKNFPLPPLHSYWWSTPSLWTFNQNISTVINMQIIVSIRYTLSLLVLNERECYNKGIYNYFYKNMSYYYSFTLFCLLQSLFDIPWVIDVYYVWIHNLLLI